MDIKTIRTAIALAAAAVTLPAAAAVSASATFSDFSFTLVDLDPYDGVTPEVMWFSTGAGYRSSAELFGEVGYQSQGTALGTVSDGAGSATADLLINPPGWSPSGLSLTASGAYALPSGQSFGGFYAFVAGDGDFYFNTMLSYSLSANTAITFSGLANVQASTTLGSTSINQTEEARASIYMMSWADNPDAVPEEAFVNIELPFRYYDPTLQRYVYNGPRSESYEDVMAVTYANSTSEWTYGGLSMGVMAYGIAAVSPVPEPSTYALMLAGLALVGGAASRKRTRAALAA